MSLWFFLYVLVKSFVVMVVSLWKFALGALALMSIPRVTEFIRQLTRGGV